MNNLTLDGKRALICGASQGIGAATARFFAAHGAEVIILARSVDKLQQVFADLQTKSGQQHAFLPLDLTNLTALQDVMSTLKPVHILVNNAGGPAPGLLLEANCDALIQGFQTHILAAQTLTQLLVPGMQALGYGRILNIISTSVKQPIAGLGVSNTIRGAMASWAKTLASELGPSGITVNNVLPGFTQTERLDKIIQTRAQKQGVSAEEIAENMRHQVPLNRFASPEEIASALLFLASPMAGYINGINLPVDGGRLQTL